MQAEDEVHTRARRYRPDTLILETDIETADGACTVVDFMPMRKAQSDLVRIVVGRRGCVRLRSDIALRFDYGRLVPWVKQLPEGFDAISGPDAVTAALPVESSVSDGKICSRFDVHEGERLHFVLTYRRSHETPPGPIDAERALGQTESEWRAWASQCTFGGRWRDIVVRSLITIKALTYAPTGGIVAAPTTSLPEKIGGCRNWDYRFCWLRDATFTLQCLSQAGYRAEAAAWRDWLLRAVAGMPTSLQPLYGIAGEHRVEESEIPWLPGFAHSHPVRIGNAAHYQLQLDVFGEVLDAMHQAREAGLPPEEASWSLQAALVDHLGSCWRQPDRGIWEVRNGDALFTHSKVMAWVAFDRAIRTAKACDYHAPLERWSRIRSEIHELVCREGFNRELGSFVRSFGSGELDASTLLIPIVGFLPADDPRVRGTVAAIEDRLMHDGFVLRYDSTAVADGLPSGEGAFLACTFWYADNLVLQGRRQQAADVFERLLKITNDVGLLPEEFNPATGELLGNFPQALSQLSLVNTAYNLTQTHGPAAKRSRGGHAPGHSDRTASAST